MISIFSHQFSLYDLFIFYSVALLIGMSKTGVQGAGMAAVPLLAMVFGGQVSSGILLPIICMADVIGVGYYHRHASWKHLKELLPWAAVGTVLGTAVGGVIDDKAFKVVMALVIMASITLMLWLEGVHKKEVPDNKWFAALMGVTGGFVSMVGNLAGSIMAVYFLSMRFPKNTFVGTTAWFFLVINLFKIPFHVFVWGTIDTNTFLLDLAALPAITLGAFAGILIVNNLREKIYRWFIIAMTIAAAVLMLF